MCAQIEIEWRTPSAPNPKMHPSIQKHHYNTPILEGEQGGAPSGGENCMNAPVHPGLDQVQQDANLTAGPPGCCSAGTCACPTAYTFPQIGRCPNKDASPGLNEQWNARADGKIAAGTAGGEYCLGTAPPPQVEGLDQCVGKLLPAENLLEVTA